MPDRRMSRAEQEEFLAGKHYAVVAVPADGKAPTLTPSWFRHDPAEGIVFTCLNSSAKAKRMSIGSPVSINVQDTSVKFGWAYVTVEGEVISIEPDKGHAEIQRLADRYLSPEDATLYKSAAIPEKWEDWPLMVVHLQPKRWFSRDYKKT